MTWVHLKQPDGSDIPQGGIGDAAKFAMAGAFPGYDPLRNLLAVLQAWDYFIVPAGTPTYTSVVKSAPGTYGGYVVVGTDATAVVNGYDNASAASGQKMFAQFSPSALGEFGVSAPRNFYNGLTLNIATATITAGNLIILYK